MKLAEALLPLRERGRGVIALVGGGGKTSALFRLASALQGAGQRVLVTSTTQLLDPRLEPCRPALRLILRPELAAPCGHASVPIAGPGLTLLMSREGPAAGKLKGIHPSWLPALLAAWDSVLVEADGSRGLPVKAPAEHEPVLPEAAALVLGVLGLECLGRPMDGATVHRPECFSAITGCQSGQAIAWAHLAALIRHPQGLFKGARGPRVLLLNKADRALCWPDPAQLAELPVDRVLIGSLEPLERVMVFQRGRRV